MFSDETIRRTLGHALLASACLLAPAVPVAAQEQHDHATLSGAAANYGRVHFPVSCSPQTQQRFDQAVAMLHSFHFPATVKAFTAITATEPDCAMAWWGVAISQRPNPLLPPFPPEALRRGWEAIQRARAAPPRTERERDWVEAMAAFFQDYEHVPQRTRTLAYEAAMERLAAKYPDDDEAQIFYALAINEAVDLSDKTYARQLKAGKILERMQARLPDHPGVYHYLIHTYDYAPLAERGLPAARRYASLAPSAGHALHMPSHIFSTLGLWNEAIPCDLAAIASFTEYYGASDPRVAGKPELIPRDYHSLDFLANAYMQLAQDQKAAALLTPYRAVTEPPTQLTTYASHTGFAAAFVRYDFDRGAWAEAAALPVPKTPYPQAEAISWFGRAIGAARSGDPAGAKTDLEHIYALGGKLADAGDAYWAEAERRRRTSAGRRGRQSSPAATGSRPLARRCNWRRRARRRRSRPGVFPRLPRRSPPCRARRSRRTRARRPYAPAAASASAGRPTPDTGRKTRSSRSRPGHRGRSDIPPRAEPASRSAAAAPDGPPPNPASAAAHSPPPVAADTAASRAVHRRVRSATARPGQPAEPGSDKCSPRPRSAAGSVRSLAGSALARTAAAKRRVSFASTISPPASRSLASRQRIGTTFG